VFAKNLKTKQFIELIDQGQAHKRKVITIKTTKDYVFTAAADSKVKQWSIAGSRMVWSTNLDWIPTTLTIANGTLFVGGPSLFESFKLDFIDLLLPQILKTKASPTLFAL
jgi:hypothetical protein